jgi:hypothetical protein
MTIREHFNRRMKACGLLILAACALVVIGIVLSITEGGGPALIFIVPPFASFIAVMVWTQYAAYRCPACTGNCGPMLGQGGLRFRVSHKLNYCPYCGIALDDEIDPLKEPDEEPF